MFSIFAQIKWPQSLTWQKVTPVALSGIVSLALLYWLNNPGSSRIPYNLTEAKKIRSALVGVLTKNYERPVEIESDSITRQLPCDQLLLTFETSIRIPYKSNELKAEINDFLASFSNNEPPKEVKYFLAKIDKLIEKECCFHISGNITRSKSLDTILAEMRIMTPCEILELP
jgi:hypothetical protein